MLIAMQTFNVSKCRSFGGGGMVIVTAPHQNLEVWHRKAIK